MKKIYWIVSYPKSGNTWLRAIVSSYLFSPSGNFNFGLLKFIEKFDILERFDFIKNVNPNDHENLAKIDVVAKYWIDAQKKLIKEDNYNLLYNFLKTHSANAEFNKHPFINSDTSGGFIYIVRDPRDVAISLSDHMGFDYDRTIEFMCNSSSTTKTIDDFPTILTRWDYNYISWKNSKLPKLIIKYEDLFNKNKIILKKISNFLAINLKLELSDLDKKINMIIQTTKFNNLQYLEKKHGFSEAPDKKKLFFRKGVIGQWKFILTNQQIKKIENTFKLTMINLKYL